MVSSILVMILYIVLHALHTHYIFRTDPLFFGGCVSCPQVQTFTWVTRQLRPSVLMLWNAPLFWSLHFGTDSSVVYMYVYIQGYGGALSRHMMLSLLEACGHVCGSWVVRVQLCLCGLRLSGCICYDSLNGLYVCIRMYTFWTICFTTALVASVWYVCYMWPLKTTSVLSICIN